MTPIWKTCSVCGLRFVVVDGENATDLDQCWECRRPKRVGGRLEIEPVKTIERLA